MRRRWKLGVLGMVLVGMVTVGQVVAEEPVPPLPEAPPKDALVFAPLVWARGVIPAPSPTPVPTVALPDVPDPLSVTPFAAP
jgi:hypothetical protein